MSLHRDQKRLFGYTDFLGMFNRKWDIVLANKYVLDTAKENSKVDLVFLSTVIYDPKERKLHFTLSTLSTLSPVNSPLISCMISSKKWRNTEIFFRLLSRQVFCELHPKFAPPKWVPLDWAMVEPIDLIWFHADCRNIFMWTACVHRRSRAIIMHREFNK